MAFSEYQKKVVKGIDKIDNNTKSLGTIKTPSKGDKNSEKQEESTSYLAAMCGLMSALLVDPGTAKRVMTNPNSVSTVFAKLNGSKGIFSSIKEALNTTDSSKNSDKNTSNVINTSTSNLKQSNVDKDSNKVNLFISANDNLEYFLNLLYSSEDVENVSTNLAKILGSLQGISNIPSLENLSNLTKQLKSITNVFSGDFREKIGNIEGFSSKLSKFTDIKIDDSFFESLKGLNKLKNIEIKFPAIDDSSFEKLETQIKKVGSIFDSLNNITKVANRRVEAEDLKSNITKLLNVFKTQTDNKSDLSELLSTINKLSTNITVTPQQIESLIGITKSLYYVVDSITKISGADKLDEAFLKIDSVIELIGDKSREGESNIYSLIDVINNLSFKEIKREADSNLIVISNFFRTLNELTDVNVLKAKFNIWFIKKFLTEDVMSIADTLQETAKRLDTENSSDVDKSFELFSSFMYAISSIVTLDSKQVKESVKSLKFLEWFLIDSIGRVLAILSKSVKDVNNNGLLFVTQLKAFFDSITSVGDFSMKKILIMSLKVDLLNDVIRSSIQSLISSMRSIKKDKLEDEIKKFVLINKLLSKYKTIDDHLPGLFGISKANTKLLLIIAMVNSLNDVIKKVNKIGDDNIDTADKTLDKIINSIVPKLAKISQGIEDITKTLNKLDKLHKILTLISKFRPEKALKVIEQEVNIIEIIVNRFSKIDIKELERLKKTIKEFTTMVLLAAGVLIIGSLLTAKIKLTDMLSFVLALGLFIGGLTTVFVVASKFVKKALEGVKDFTYLVLAASAVMIIGAMLYKHISFDDLLGFTLMLSGFIIALMTVYAVASRMIKDTLHIAKSFTMLVMISAATLLLGSLLTKVIKWEDALSFTLMLGAFISVMLFIYWVASKKIEKSFEIAASFTKLIWVSAATLLAGAIIYHFIPFADVVGFAVILAAFLAAVCAPYIIWGKKIKDCAKTAFALAALVAVSGVILLVAAKLLSLEDFFMAIGFAVVLGLFIWGITAAFSHNAKNIAKAFLPALGLSLLVLISGGILIFAAKYLSDDELIMALKFGGVLLLFTGLMGLMCGVMGKFAKEVGLGILCMVGIIALIWLSGLAMKEIVKTSLLVTDIGHLWAFVGSMIGILALYAGMVAGIAAIIGAITTSTAGIGGLALAGIIAAAEGILISIIGLITLSAKAMGLIADTMIKFKKVENFDTTKFKTLLKDYVSACNEITETSVDANKIKELGNAISTLSPVIDSMANISKTLNQIIKDHGDNGSDVITTITDNIGKLLLGIGTAITNVTTKNDFDKWAKSLPKVSKMFFNVAMALVPIARGVREFATMTFTNPKTGEKELVTPDMLKDAGESIQTILTCIGTAVAMVANSDAFTGWGIAVPRVTKMFKSISGSLIPIARAVKMYANMTFIDADGKETRITTEELKNVGGSIQSILEALGGAVNKVAEGKAFGRFNSSAKKVTDMFKNISGAIMPIAMATKMFADMTVVDHEGNKTILKGSNVFTQIGDNIKKILMAIASGVVDTVNSKEYAKYFKSGDKSPALTAAKVIAQTAQPVVDIAQVLNYFSGGKIVDRKYDANGKIVSETITTMPNINKAKENIENILKAIIGVITDVYKDKEAVNAFKGKDNAAQNIVNAITQLSSTIVSIIEQVKKIEDTQNKLKVNLDTIVAIRTNLDEIFDGKDQKGGLLSLMASINTSSESFEKYSKKDYRKKIDKIIDAVEPVKKLATSIASAIAEMQTALTKVNTENLDQIDTLINKFVSVTEALKKITDNESVDITSFGKSGIIYKINDWINSVNSIADISKYTQEVGPEGYDIISEGIENIYQKTNEIADNDKFRQHTDTLERYVTTINKINTQKIDKLTSLTNAMNILATKMGNVDKFTEVLAENISQVLDRLTKELKVSKETIEKAEKIQEKRHKLIQESIKSVKEIMDDPLKVEIRKVDDTNDLQNNNDRTPGFVPPPTEDNKQQTVSSGGTNTSLSDAGGTNELAESTPTESAPVNSAANVPRKSNIPSNANAEAQYQNILNEIYAKVTSNGRMLSSIDDKLVDKDGISKSAS